MKDANGATLDGNGDGLAGDNYVFKFHRLAGDTTGDAKVDVGDLGILGASYGQTVQPGMAGDLNGDGRVDVGDLGILGASYGRVLPL